jgi:hypothetical protein
MLVRNPLGKQILGKVRRWEHNPELDYKKIDCEDKSWSDVIHDHVCWWLWCCTVAPADSIINVKGWIFQWGKCRKQI